jgi:hypothetical protein
MSPQAPNTEDTKDTEDAQAHAAPWKSGASAPRQTPTKQPGFSPRGGFADTTPSRRKLQKNFVIPNRAESPVRNLLFVDATKNTGCPIACPERSQRVSLLLRDVGYHERVPLGGRTPRPGRARLKSCRHSDKTHTAFGDSASTARQAPQNLVVPNQAGSPVRNLLSTDANKTAGGPSFAHLWLSELHRNPCLLHRRSKCTIVTLHPLGGRSVTTTKIKQFFQVLIT